MLMSVGCLLAAGGICSAQTVAETSAAAGTSSAIPAVWWLAPVASIAALIVAYIFYKKVIAMPEGNEKMVSIAENVREGAYAYLFSQYRVVAIVFVILFFVLVALAYLGVQNPFVPIAFLTAGFFSALCGFLGMKTATNASARTTQGAVSSLNKALQVAFKAGAVMGLVVVGFGLGNIVLWYLVLDKLIYTPEHMRRGLEFLGLILVPEGMPASHKLVEISTTMVTF